MDTGSVIESVVDAFAALAKLIAAMTEADREKAIEYARKKHGDAYAAKLRMMVDAQLELDEVQAEIVSARLRGVAATTGTGETASHDTAESAQDHAATGGTAARGTQGDGGQEA